MTVRHTFTGQPPEEGTYLATTVIHMDSDFYSVVAIPTGGGGTWYGYFDGDHVDGMVTIVDGGVAVPNVSVEGTLQITELTLDGSGTFHDADADTDALMSTWEILSAPPALRERRRRPARSGRRRSAAAAILAARGFRRRAARGLARR